MKYKLALLFSLLTTGICCHAQNVYVLNRHSQLERMTPAFTSGTQQTKKVPPAFSLIIGGKEAELVLPMGSQFFYVKITPGEDIKSWKLVPLKKWKKTDRHLPYIQSDLFSGRSSTSTTSNNFLNVLGGIGSSMTTPLTQSTSSNVVFEKAVRIDDFPLRYERISDELYKIYPPKDALKSGEYAFIRMEGNMPVEVFDFKIDKSLPSIMDIPSDEAVMAQLDIAAPPATISPLQNNVTDNTLIAAAKSSTSDVDRNIPTTKKVAEHTFALIISNENYKRVENVPFAHNDGNIFAQYLKLAIGVPDSHITHLKDASLSDIKYALNHLQEISDAFDGKAKFIIHYSGHGIPDEKNKEGYLLPVDGYASDPSTAYKLSEFYSCLSNMNSESVVLFLDACFSGTQKSGEMLASARGVAIKINDNKPTGNLIVLSAAQGDQTAYPYAEKCHGMMTYFLLKKLQETSGDTKLGELSDYITNQVKRTSLLENGKSQIPTTMVDENNKKWRNISLKE